MYVSGYIRLIELNLHFIISPSIQESRRRLRGLKCVNSNGKGRTRRTRERETERRVYPTKKKKKLGNSESGIRRGKYHKRTMGSTFIVERRRSWCLKMLFIKRNYNKQSCRSITGESIIPLY